MINIISINPTGFFSYGIHDTVNLDGHGVVLLEGRNKDRDGGSNGSGKTSLFNALTQILFAKNPTGEYNNSVINKALGRAFGRVTFLDSNGVKWRVTDVKKWRKTDTCPDASSEPSWTDSYSGTDVYLDRWDGRQWVDERSTNKVVGESRLDLKATRKRIISILGMDYERFMSVSYLAQQQSLKFINGTHKERMEILSDIADLTAWDRRVQAVKEDINSLSTDIDKKQFALDVLARTKDDAVTQADIDQSARIIDIVSEEIVDIEKQIKEIASHNAYIDAQIASHNSLFMQKVQELSKVEQDERDVAAKIAAAFTQQKSMIDAVRASPTPNEVAELQLYVNQLKWELVQKRDQLEQLMTGAGRCNKCLSQVTDVHLERHRTLINVEIKTIQDSIAATEGEAARLLKAHVDTISEQIAVIEMQFRDQDEFDRKIQNELKYKTDLLKQEVNKIRSDTSSIAASKKSDSSLQLELYQKIAKLSSEKTNYASLMARLTKKNQAGAERLQLIADINADNTKLKYLRLIATMFGDKGVKAHKLHSALAGLNILLQKYAKIVTGDHIDLWVTQYREKADGESTVDIQVMVREGEKDEVPLSLYSGGEKQQITLAFIASFWELASNYGSGVNILCLDEIFGPLDHTSADRVFDFISALKLHGKSTIFVVTHDDSIRNRMPLDTTWTVVKHKHTSKIQYS